jgi:hypothetical protein
MCKITRLHAPLRIILCCAALFITPDEAADAAAPPSITEFGAHKNGRRRPKLLSARA